MVTTKNVTVDVMDLSANSTRVAGAKGYLEEIDYSIGRRSSRTSWSLPRTHLALGR